MTEVISILAASIAGFILGYVLLWQIMAREGLTVGGRSGGAALAYLVASLLSGIGFIFGVLLLIVPGLLLMARWSLIPAMIVGRGLSISQAFEESWRATRSTQWTIVGFFCLLFLAIGIALAMLGGAVAFIVMVDPGSADPLSPGSPLSLLTEGIGNIGGGLSCCSFVALFSLVVEAGPDSEHIFA
jgi:hypothetical protein